MLEIAALFPSLVLGLLSICFTIISFFVVRTLNKIDINQNTLFQQISDLKKEFYQLKGEHTAHHDKE